MAGNPSHTFPDLWGGVECTVNRVADKYFDQLERSGHDRRPGDLDRIAALGIKTLRFPLLWERVAPEELSRADWTWPDQRLGHLEELGITPIVGLIHHGSGPRHTNLLDPAFPLLLAEYAAEVARRYPHLSFYTPVNEPLTTARFSGLYGYWYPHAADPRAFARALLHQCRGVVLSMERIREINPKAQLVQTDDLGKVFSTRLLAYQAKFENERRWLTYDLLCGRVRREHPLWNYLRREAAVPVEELQFFIDHPCPPDIIGVNYYLTSERLLDERLALYPPSTHGGNGRHAYADVEAVRLRPEGLAGPRALLMEAWERYQLPLAVTEVHNGCTREEQLRWLLEVWDAATHVKASGADLRAVTVWALLGAYDWNSLVTRMDGFYEPGAFDVRSPEPRPTALATMARELAHHRPPSHPVLDMPGWWRRSKRLLYPQALNGEVLRPSRPPPAARPLLITGATGTLGQAFARQCDLRGLAYRMVTRAEMDIADEHSVEAALALHGPWAVINTAGYVRVDEAEVDRERCFRENSDGPETLSVACRSRGIRLATFSSDLVFDGASRAPYTEECSPAPLNVYGESKAAAERRVLAADPTALVIRTSAFFGPWDEHNFVTRAMRLLQANQECIAADDAVVSPTYVPDLVNAALDLLIDGESGVWHLANVGAVSWAELARSVARRLGLDSTRVVGRPQDQLRYTARRPSYSALISSRASLMPSLEHAIERYLSESEFGRRTERPEAAAELLGA